QNIPARAAQLSGVEVELQPHFNRRSRFDLTLSMAERDGQLLGSFEYDRDLFDEATAARWSRWYRTLLGHAVRAPDTRLADLDLGDTAVPPALPPCPVTDPRDWAGDEAVHRVFERRAAAAGERPAVHCNGQMLTYAELDARANRLARRLRRAGVTLESRVALYARRSVHTWVAMLGVWKAGAAYVPLDPAFPPARLAAMVTGSAAGWILSEDDPAALADWLPAAVTPLQLATSPIIGDARGDSDDPSDARPLDIPVPGDALAYILHTSGSTGRPKGVAISHRAAIHFLAAMTGTLAWDHDTVLLAVTTLGFDISLLERIGPLLVGGQSVLADDETCRDGRALGDLLRSCSANAMQATPATWRLLQAVHWTGADGLTALCGGEALPGDLAAWLGARCAALWNVYGPTETTVWSTAQRVELDPDGDPGILSIGQPLGETRLHIVDHRLRPVPLGVWGELLIGGPSLARGYVGQPAETARRFVPDPFAAVPGQRLYRTGDLCRVTGTDTGAGVL
ncbi:MAG: amino acid adenylation domain-containing protein, partial [Myxococcota bacterium]